MSKIAPCLWFDSDAEEAANFYVSGIPDSSITHVQKNVSDGPSGPAGPCCSSSSSSPASASSR